MEDILVRPKSEKEAKELLEFIKSRKISYDIITEELEDIALLNAMKQIENETSKSIGELYKEMGWEWK